MVLLQSNNKPKILRMNNTFLSIDVINSTRDSVMMCVIQRLTIIQEYWGVFKDYQIFLSVLRFYIGSR